jgi:hypothetical protein
LKPFVEYHKKKGIEHFYMYYNGPLSEEPIESVTFIEWNFPYWLGKQKQNAQHAHLNHALYKYGKSTCDFILNSDLDEYIVSKEPLLEFVKKVDKDLIMFHNMWCDTIDENDESILRGQLPKRFVTDGIIWQPGQRSKCIYRTSTMRVIIGVHHSEGSKHIDKNNMLFHFFRWSTLCEDVKRNRGHVQFQPLCEIEW